MTLLIASALLALLTAGWVIVPLLRRESAVIEDAGDARRLDADARKRVALASLREVEYDRFAGKLDEVDYRELRGRLEQEALVAIRASAEAETPGEVEPAAQAVAGPGAAAHACGYRNPEGSRFCAGCGEGLAA